MTRAIAAAAALLLLAAALSGAQVPPAADAPDPVGGRKYYLCVLGQALKIGGLILVRPDVVLVGAIVGGLACGLGI